MININLFVACPPKSDALNKQKEALADLCKEMGINYATDIEINAVTYNVPENRKKVGDEYIKNKADIVIFLIDKERDEILMDELKLAVKQNKVFNKPKLFVYVSNKIKDKEDLDFDREINQILDDSGLLPESITNTNKLVENTRKKIQQYKRSSNRIRRLQRRSKVKFYGTYLVLPIAFAFVCLFAVLWINAESRRLLIVGGGSARQFIEDSLIQKENGIGANYLNLYAAMPSGESYRILSEERIKNYNGETYKNRPYYPIVISAQEASEEEFLGLSNKQEFRETGIIIGKHLSDDWLVAYGSKHAFDRIKKSDTEIKVSTIDSIVLTTILDSITSQIDVYTTSEKSGTLNAYYKACDSIKSRDSIFKRRRIGFSNKDYLPKKGNMDNWIALGSNYYRPLNKNMESLVILDNDDLKITKKIYVYFMLYKYKTKNGTVYVMPKATKKFLKKLKLDNGDLKKIERIKTNDMTVLYDTTKVLFDYDSIILNIKKNK